MIHPCPQEHPWALTDAPREVISIWWQDAMDAESPDAGSPLLDAWYLIPKQRDVS